MKKFKVFYKDEKERHFPRVTPFRGYEFIEADDIAKAKKAAEVHAKEAGWKIDFITEQLDS